MHPTDHETPARVCRGCKFELSAVAFSHGSTICEVCADRTPSTAAGANLSAAFDGDTSTLPQHWDDYRATSALADAASAERTAQKAREVEAERNLRQVEQEVAAAAAMLEVREPSPEWSVMVGMPLVSAWDRARRLAGRPPILDTLRSPRRAPLGSTTDALLLLVVRDVALGRSAGQWSRTTDEERGKRKAAEVGRSEVEGIFRAAVAADRDEDVAARARMRVRGRERPKGADGVEAAGWLPADWMQAKQSRNGSTGGAAGDGLVELRVDVGRAVAAAGLAPRDLQHLVWRDIGEMQVVRKGRSELVRLSTTEIAARESARRERLGLDPVSVQAMGKGLTKWRDRLHDALQGMGLVAAAKRHAPHTPSPPASTPSRARLDAW